MYCNVRWLFLVFGKSLLRKISGFDRYININKDIDLVNEEKNICYKDYCGNLVNDSFMELYDKSVDLTVERINSLK